MQGECSGEGRCECRGEGRGQCRVSAGVSANECSWCISGVCRVKCWVQVSAQLVQGDCFGL